jgi:hypothetical protein
LSQNNLVININGQEILIPRFNALGFPQVDAATVTLYHTTANCSGPRYLQSLDLPRSGVVDASRLYFAKPVQSRTMMSAEIFNTGQSLSGAGTCVVFTTTSLFGLVAPPVNLLAFGFVPPFHAGLLLKRDEASR